MRWVVALPPLGAGKEFEHAFPHIPEVVRALRE